MNDRFKKIAEACLRGAENDTMTFPQIVGKLMEEGFESYSIDYRRAKAIYYRPDGDSLEVATHGFEAPVSEAFNTAAIQTAIREAQQLTPGYTYTGFCRKVIDAGCAGYIVSFIGRRAVYFGRAAETHIEHFPS